MKAYKGFNKDKDYKVIVIDGNNYKADTYYTIKDGDIVEV